MIKLYRYQVFIYLTSFLPLSGRKIFLLKEDNTYSEYNYMFYTNSLKELCNLNNIYIVNLHKINIKAFLKNYIITLFGIISFLFMFIFINLSVTDIKFYNEMYENEEVYDFINDKVNSFLNYNYIFNSQINDINDEIRSVFYKYQWISVEKKGTIIYVDIAKIQNTEEQDIQNNKKGSLYSKYDALIVGYYVNKGKVLIKKDMMVKVDDELISGCIELYDNKKEYITASGYVLGEVNEYITIEIEKEEVNVKRSGKIAIKDYYTIFGKDINNPIIPFESYDIEDENINIIKNVFGIRRVIAYEIEETTIKYNKEDAIIKAESMIISDFIANKKYDSEKIKRIIFIDVVDEIDSYKVTFLLNSIKDITYFKEFSTYPD